MLGHFDKRWSDGNSVPRELHHHQPHIRRREPGTLATLCEVSLAYPAQAFAPVSFATPRSRGVQASSAKAIVSAPAENTPHFINDRLPSKPGTASAPAARLPVDRTCARMDCRACSVYAGCANQKLAGVVAAERAACRCFRLPFSAELHYCFVQPADLKRTALEAFVPTNRRRALVWAWGTGKWECLLSRPGIAQVWTGQARSFQV